MRMIDSDETSCSVCGTSLPLWRAVKTIDPNTGRLINTCLRCYDRVVVPAIRKRDEEVLDGQMADASRTF